MKQHRGDFEGCAYCLRYIRLGASISADAEKGYTSTTRKLHRIAIARQGRDQAMRDVGLTKVRGNLGGTYWE